MSEPFFPEIESILFEGPEARRDLDSVDPEPDDAVPQAARV